MKKDKMKLTGLVAVLLSFGSAFGSPVRPPQPPSNLVSSPLPVPTTLDKPITIEEALQIAFQKSPTLRIALSHVESTRGALDETKARFNPTFSASGTTTYQGPDRLGQHRHGVDGHADVPRHDRQPIA